MSSSSSSASARSIVRVAMACSRVVVVRVTVTVYKEKPGFRKAGNRELPSHLPPNSELYLRFFFIFAAAIPL